MPEDKSGPGVGVLEMTAPASLQGLRVLVVEDEMMVSMLIEDMLSDLGCTVIGPASRLDEAIELTVSAELDCAVLDVNSGASRSSRWPTCCVRRESPSPSPPAMATPACATSIGARRCCRSRSGKVTWPACSGSCRSAPARSYR
jgi:CheY-like chemotaxis protein